MGVEVEVVGVSRGNLILMSCCCMQVSDLRNDENMTSRLASCDVDANGAHPASASAQHQHLHLPNLRRGACRRTGQFFNRI